MTVEEFDKTGFIGQMKCRYKLQEYDIIAVGLDEKLIAINETQSFDDEGNEDEMDWKRCENITLIN